MSGRSVSGELANLVERHGVSTRGVLHVGANRGQEVPGYRGVFDRIRLVEPIPELAAELPGDCEVIAAAVGAERGEATLYVPKRDRYASLLEPRKRAVEREVTVPIVPLRDIQQGCSVLVVDAQGAELDVLRTGDLGAFEMIVVETCTKRRYRKGALRAEVLGVLSGWRLVAEYSHRTAGVSDCVLVR